MADPESGLRTDSSGGVKSYCKPGTKAFFALFPARSLPESDIVYKAFSTTTGLFSNSISIWSPDCISSFVRIAVKGADGSFTPPSHIHLN